MNEETLLIREPARNTRVRASVDVLVVGGGPAGIMAAEAAAGNGLKVMLLESKSFLGGNLYITNALKGQKHQHRATPCDWITEPFQALKGRYQTSFQITPFQGSNLRVYSFHRALPDANAKRLSALDTVTSCLFFIPKHTDNAD